MESDPGVGLILIGVVLLGLGLGPLMLLHSYLEKKGITRKTHSLGYGQGGAYNTDGLFTCIAMLILFLPFIIWGLWHWLV